MLGTVGVGDFVMVGVLDGTVGVRDGVIVGVLVGTVAVGDSVLVGVLVGTVAVGVRVLVGVLVGTVGVREGVGDGVSVKLFTLSVLVQVSPVPGRSKVRDMVHVPDQVELFEAASQTPRVPLPASGRVPEAALVFWDEMVMPAPLVPPGL